MSLPKNIDPSKSNPEDCSSISRRQRPTTNCTTITGAGRSAIAVIAIRGPNADEIVSRCFQAATKSRFSPSEIRYGVWTGPPSQSVAGESVVVTPLGDDHFEIHCHGGPAAQRRIMEDLNTAGASPIPSDRWSLASANLLIHEAGQVLSRCITARTAAIVMDQVRGAMFDWATNLLRTEQKEAAVEIAKRDAAAFLGFAPLATRLDQPFRVVLVGPPNVGKSSLLNAIAGFNRSITMNVAGTTRDVLHADTVIDGLPIRLSDTAGIRDSDQPIEKQGIARARTAAREADLVLSIRQPDLARQGVGETALLWPKRVIPVLNKCDLLQNRGSGDENEIPTNALTGEGVAELMVAIADILGGWIPKPASPVPVNDRQASLLGEIVATNDQDRVSALLRELLGVNF